MVLAALLTVAHAADVQTVVLHVSFGALAPDAVTATVQQDGAFRELTLVDDGSDTHDARGDRVWTGSIQGKPSQFLGVRLAVDSAGSVADVYDGVIRVGLERSVDLAFEVTRDPRGELVGARRSTASPGRLSHAAEALPMLAVSVWGTLVLVWTACALRLRR